MKLFLLLILTISFSVCHGQKTDSSLFQIFENDKIGFINASGQVIIQPIYLSAENFSEDLAAVRINSNYGYIDGSGEFTIPPQYDYATPFKNGFAIVYNDGKPIIINKAGKIPFELNYSAVEPFENGRMKVKTATNKFGFINTQGKLIIDTAFQYIFPFVNGFAVARGLNDNQFVNYDNKSTSNNEIGVIDTLGKFKIPYGKYNDIQNSINGYYKVGIPAEVGDTEGITARTGFVNADGNLIFSRNYINNGWIMGDVYCGLTSIKLYKYWLQVENNSTYNTDNSYEGFINLNGEIVINDTNFIKVYNFSDNRAFIKDKNGNYSVIDTIGKIISVELFTEVEGLGYKNGYAIVKQNDKYGVIDSNVNFIVKPKFDRIAFTGIIDDYFFYLKIKEDSTEGNYLFGIATLEDSILIVPIMQDFSSNGFKNGILACRIKHKLTYINKEGKIIWQESDRQPNQTANLNIDFMNRAYFYAGSIPNKTDLGGYGPSGNFPQKISKTDIFPSHALSVTVRPDIKDTTADGYNGIAVFVANNSKKKLKFNAENSRLHMKVQALNEQGEWKDIEYLPNSWCGNSYHTLTLNSKQFWVFTTPNYEGAYKTKLRIELRYIDPKDNAKLNREKKELVIYSNEYDGCINNSQFWRIQDYHSDGIIKSYTTGH